MALPISRASAAHACVVLTTILLAACARAPDATVASPEPWRTTTTASDPAVGAHASRAKTDSPGARQAQRGAELFTANCSPCHGPSGGGSEIAPPLVGPNALPTTPRPTQTLRTMPFHSAKDVYAFMSTYMPRSSPGALPPDQYYAILAFLLQANGMRSSSSALDAQNVGSVELR